MESNYNDKREFLNAELSKLCDDVQKAESRQEILNKIFYFCSQENIKRFIYKETMLKALEKLGRKDFIEYVVSPIKKDVETKDIGVIQSSIITSLTNNKVFRRDILDAFEKDLHLNMENDINIFEIYPDDVIKKPKDLTNTLESKSIRLDNTKSAIISNYGIYQSKLLTKNHVSRLLQTEFFSTIKIQYLRRKEIESKVKQSIIKTDTNVERNISHKITV